ncbi:PREDICTED: sialin-like, partial [Nicrophorus vespilloides]|uniref:Sialin-like n=1 Tax=Nicrophorus vespilloides TaxID=110193 RepID=A0ABM1M024_NICVS
APVPWRSILSSWPVWLNILAQWGGIWGLFTAMTHAPTYFKVIHGWNIKATGLLSGMPHFIRMAWAYVFSRIGDYLLSTNKMTRTNVRKLATFFACIVHGFCMLALAYSGCNSMAAIVFLTAATAIHGAVSTGSLASFVDLSPNYASVQLGLSGMISVLPGFISPAIVGILTYNNQTASQWQKVFWISAFMLIVPGILYLFFAKSELQDWNSPTTGDSALESEMKTLKNGKVQEDDEEDEDKEDVTHNKEEKVEV